MLGSGTPGAALLSGWRWESWADRRHGELVYGRPVGETRVDLLHLLEDLRDAYPGSTEETILAEVVANSLDSGATAITFTTDPVACTLTIVDDGTGMRRRELARYHDIAASTKVRGERIGFAGVGIKIGLLVSQEVVTETRLGKHHVATTWALTSRHRAPWRWIPPPGLVGGRGTAVRLRVDNPLSPLLDPGFVEASVRRHYQPLFDPALTDILAARYPRGIRFAINGELLHARDWTAPEVAPIAVRVARKRKPSVAGYLVRERLPLPEEQRGVAISTFGKVIRRGWDWLGVTPSSPAYVGGLIEAPALAECLTLNKADFIRAGARAATWLLYRKAIQEVVSRQLAAWGDVHDAGEQSRRRVARPVERDLEAVLLDLANRFPLLSALVEKHAGGQRQLGAGRADQGKTLGEALGQTPLRVLESATVNGMGPPPAGPGERPRGDAPESPPPAAIVNPLVEGHAAPRAARYGLSIQFESRPDDPELGRLVESTVWVNEAHPAYRRAVASRSEGYHVALACAMALAAVAVEPAKEHAFITAFLTSWGEAIERRRQARRRR
jgi:Histidine kinase-, DNA gyrase B-, and HSP90-like ATPase